MTTTAPNASDPTTSSDTSTPGVADSVELVHIDPAALLVDTNIREAHLDRAFLASIKDHGVLEPIVAVRTTASSDADGADSALRVRHGHRRTLAAIQAGRTTVPAYVTGTDDTSDAGAAARIVAQWTENEHRAALTTAERIETVHQLSLLGLSAGHVAHRTKTRKNDVANALTASASPVTVKAAGRFAFLTLDQAAALAEFDPPHTDTDSTTDSTAVCDTEAIAALVAAAKDGPVQFARALTVARTNAAERAARTEAATALTASGVQVIDKPSWADPDKPTELSLLSDPDGNRLTVEDHATCPGHAAWLDQDWTRDQPDNDHDVNTDQSQDDADVDDADADVDDDVDGDGWQLVYVPVYVCTDPTGYGHHQRGYRETGSHGGHDGQSKEQRKEAARQQRREVIANNKAMAASEPIRREFLTRLLSRKTAPKGSATFITAALLTGDANTSQTDRALICQLLAMTQGTDIGQVAAEASEARALVIALGVTLAGYEAQIARDAWRRTYATRGQHAYLNWLETYGYPLSEVEALAAGKHGDTDDTASAAVDGAE